MKAFKLAAEKALFSAEFKNAFKCFLSTVYGESSAEALNWSVERQQQQQQLTALHLSSKAKASLWINVNAPNEKCFQQQRKK
ncbi:hypothetical protein T05_10246 [Trichinella murrelli]|uniref:Uncharacterized protein n=1 Tax=Trichinella murrelli TaxID=144512 RepID=A0A0V0TA74_9BILA|nr:hypothetical protein T05_10246 [Trichinella murrelli]